MITKVTRKNKVLAGLTTESAESHYGQPVYKWTTGEELHVGDELIVTDDNDSPGYEEGSEAEVLWADAYWAVLRIPKWADSIQCVHLATGYVGQPRAGRINAALSWDCTPAQVAAWARGEHPHGKPGVDGAIDDWAGETIALVL